MISDNYSAVFGTFRVTSLAPIVAASRMLQGKKVLVDTGLAYNVDSELRNLDWSKFDLMTKIHVEHIKNYDSLVANHMKWIGVDTIKYALVHFPEDGWKDLVALMLADKRIENVGVSNFNIDQIKEYYNTFHSYPCCNEIEFSIIYHDLNLVRFCRDHGIEVLGYGIFHGIHDSKLTIREFTTEACIGFCINHGVIPIIRTDNLDHAVRDIVVSNSRINLHNHEKIESISYNLDSDNVSSEKALNKFKYSHPRNLIKYLLHNSVIVSSLDSRSTDHLLNTGLVNEISVDDLKSLVELPYQLVEYSHMMITDYLVEYKYENYDPDDNILMSDDICVNMTKKEIVGFIITDDQGNHIKSGSEGSKVYQFIIKF